jgi:hypothetical protein
MGARNPVIAWYYNHALNLAAAAHLPRQHFVFGGTPGVAITR